MRSFAAAALLTFLAVPAVPQEKLVETLEVRVVNIDVVVRDRAGKPVTGLTKDDFEIFENGKKQEVSNLYEVRPEAAAPTGATAMMPPAIAADTAPVAPLEVRSRKFVIFIDNYSLAVFRRNEILKSLNKFIDTELKPEDQAMILLWNHQLKPVTKFTNDRKVLKDGIASVSEQSNAGFTNQMEVDRVKRQSQEFLDVAKEPNSRVTYQQAYTMAIGAVDTYADAATHNATRLLEDLGRTTAALAGHDGKKIIVFAGAHLPERPAADLYLYLYNLFSPYDRTIKMDNQSMTGHSGAVHFSIDAAAKQAAANGVTLYMIDAADGRDTITAERGGESAIADATESFGEYSNTSMAYHTLARVTGGVAVTNVDNFDYAFTTISRDLSSYYSLGYKPTEESSGTQRKVVVKVKKPGLSARSRETYTAKTVEEAMKDRVIANIATAVTSEWPIELKAGTPEKDGNQFKVPVQVTMAPNVTLLPRDNQLVGGFILYIAVGNANGKMSTVTRVPQAMKIPPEAEKQLRSKPMSFTAMIQMSPGENTLSIGVMDQITNAAGFGRTTVTTQ